MNQAPDALHRLLSAAAVRERAHEMLDLALEGKIEGWAVDLDRLPAVADLVAAITRERFPTLCIPVHARWRHFVAGAPQLPSQNELERDEFEQPRASFDLVVLSVLLDAGAGMTWRFADPVSGKTLERSEGLAVASQRMFEAGVFSSDPARPLRADGEALATVDETTLTAGFQVSEANPLAGLAGRAALLRRLGEHILDRPDLFSTPQGLRPAGLFDALLGRSTNWRLPATALLELLLEALGPIWADRLIVGGFHLGDCWYHPAIRRNDASDCLVPLHKLSQWLAYSLAEPLEDAGLRIEDFDGLTGLAEYRNGGLFVDMAVLRLADPADAARNHKVSDPLIVAWRAMTVALLDRLAPLVRERLGVGAADFPLARMLEGGTWQAGRRVAAERRADGGPPFNIISDGTVF